MRPYQKVSLKYIGHELSLTIPEVELLIVDLISNQRIDALLNQPEGMLETKRAETAQDPLIKWMSALDSLGSELVEQYC